LRPRCCDLSKDLFVTFRAHSLRNALAALSLAALVVAVAACGGSSGKQPNTATTPSDFNSGTGSATSTSGLKGAVITSGAVPMPNVTLTDTAGKPFNLATDTKGYVTMFYMGYTHCPDACPQAMAQMGAVMSSLPANISNKVKVIFFTTDPERDTPTALRTWLDQFDKNIIGLTGSVQQITGLEQTMGIPVQQEPKNPDGTYAIDHLTAVFAFTAQDQKAHTLYPGGFSNADIASDITTLVTKGFQS